MERIPTRANGSEYPRKFDHIIAEAVEEAVVKPWVSANRSMVKKALKPLVNFLCSGGTPAGLGECSPEAAAKAGELYCAALGLKFAAVRECLAVAKDNGIVPEAQVDLYDRVRTVIWGLLPLALEATREGEAIADATRSSLPAERHGRQHAAIRDKSAMHARWRLIEHVATLDEWPEFAPADDIRLLGAASGRALTDAEVNPAKTESGDARYYESVDVAALAASGLRMALFLTKGRREVAEDLVQDAFLRLHEYGVQQTNVTYVRTIIHRLAANEANRAAKAAAPVDDEILEIVAERGGETEENAELLLWSLRRLVRRTAGCVDRDTDFGQACPESEDHAAQHAAAQAALRVIPRLFGRDEVSDRRRARSRLGTILEEEVAGYDLAIRAEVASLAQDLLERCARKVTAA